MPHLSTPAVRRLATSLALTLAASTTALVGGAVTAPAQADPAPVITIWSVTDSVTEGDLGEADLGFRRSGDLSAPSSAKVTITDGTAVRGSDFTASAFQTTLRFKAGESVRFIRVPIKDDQVVEPDETFDWALSAPVNASIAAGPGTVTIVDDDTNDPPTFRISDDGRYEGGAGTVTLTFIVARDGSTASRASVMVASVAGSATAPSDYQTKRPTRIAFAVGQQAKLVQVTVRSDLEPETDESFGMVLSSPKGATIADGEAVGTIYNDDSDDPPTFFVFDQLYGEGDSGAATFFVRRDGDLRGTSSVDFATADGTAVAPADYAARSGTVTFPPGESTVFITIALKDDEVPEPQETFVVNLSNPVGGTIARGSAVMTISDAD
ncbi:Calx-beta domain-containing protein [Nocardioides humilatus]|nr:Calx-beta domain-containing protein [Nocardioides humilatus]